MSPRRRAKNEQAVREELEQMLLAELRRLAGMTQVQVAQSMGIAQPTLSQLERQDDMQISTLQRIIEALDGELEIVAKLPSGRVLLSQFKERRWKLQTA